MVNRLESNWMIMFRVILFLNGFSIDDIDFIVNIQAIDNYSNFSYLNQVFLYNFMYQTQYFFTT
jgi:hypothetical protein